MVIKRQVSPHEVDLSFITMEKLLYVFQRARSQANLKAGEVDSRDKDLPRVPYRVEQIESTSPDEIAHFLRYYRKPNTVVGTLTLKRPNFNGLDDTKKKP